MSLKEFVYNSVVDKFSSLQGTVVDIAEQLLISPEQFNPFLWDLVNRIQDVILPIAYELLVVFFLLELVKTSTTMEVTFEKIVKVLLKTCFLKVVIEKSFYLLGLILQLSINAVYSVNSLSGTNFNSPILFDDIRAHINSMGTLDLILYYISLVPLSSIMDLASLAISLIIFGRFIEIYMHMAIAPLPLSTLANEDLHNTGKSFLLSYAAVCFQALIILIGCKLYGGMIQSMALTGTGGEALKNLVLMALVLLFILVRSGTWAKKITGAA